MKLAKLLLTLVLASFACLTVANPMWEPDLPRAKSAFEKETRVPLRAGHYIEPTLFKGFYAVRTGQAGGPSAYFREDMGWLGNIKSPGWVIQSPAEDNPAYKHTWLRQQLAQIPLEQLVLVKRSTPPVAVIWSAPDCPYCRKLEKTLEQENASVYVVTVGVAENGFRQAARVYCADDPAQAWRKVMQGSEINGRAKTSCQYPRDMLNDIGFFLGMGRMATPIVVFADGSTVIGWNDQNAWMLLRKKISEQIFFND